MVRPLTLISKCGVNSPKFSPLSPLSLHISHDANSTKQVYLLQTFYKMNQVSFNDLRFNYSSTQYIGVLERKLT